MSQIDPKAYAEPCGCGALAGEPCPHTPIRCKHDFWYGQILGGAGPCWKGKPANVKVGLLRTCEFCGFQERAAMTWEIVRASRDGAEAS